MKSYQLICYTNKKNKLLRRVGGELILLRFLLLSIGIILPLHNTLAIGWFGEQLDGTPCQGNSQAFGPYDYLAAINPKNKKLYQQSRIWEVNKIHYGKGQETILKEGVTKSNIGHIWAEYDYTLRAFPNHALALYAVIQLEIKRLSLNKTNHKFYALKTPPECYLQRASKFRPNQPHIPLLYGIYLHRLKKFNEAEKFYKNALELDPNYAEAHYNYGLLLIDLKQFDNAATHANKAYKLNYKLPGLKQKLIDQGYWPKVKNEKNVAPLQ